MKNTESLPVWNPVMNVNILSTYYIPWNQQIITCIISSYFYWELYEIDTKMITIIFLFTDGETEAHCLGFPKFSCSKWQK